MTFGMVMNFAEILVYYRKDQSLTQKALSKRLRALDNKNYGIDEITISRWENKYSSPSIKKQCSILISLKLERFIPQAVLYYYRQGKYKLSLGDRYRKGFQVTDIPYMKNEHVYVKRYSQIPIDKIDFYCDYHSNIYDLKLDDKSISKISRVAESECLIECFTKNDEIVGHLLYVVVDNSDLKYLFDSPCVCKASFQSGKSIYVISSYASTEMIFKYFIDQIVNVLLMREGPELVYIKSTFNELKGFFSNLSAQVIEVGSESKFGPRYKGVYYNWILYEIERINIVSSKESILFLADNISIEEVC